MEKFQLFAGSANATSGTPQDKPIAPEPIHSHLDLVEKSEKQGVVFL